MKIWVNWVTNKARPHDTSKNWNHEIVYKLPKSHFTIPFILLGTFSAIILSIYGGNSTCAPQKSYIFIFKGKTLQNTGIGLFCFLYEWVSKYMTQGELEPGRKTYRANISAKNNRSRHADNSLDQPNSIDMYTTFIHIYVV